MRRLATRTKAQVSWSSQTSEKRWQTGPRVGRTAGPNCQRQRAPTSTESVVCDRKHGPSIYAP